MAEDKGDRERFRRDDDSGEDRPRRRRDDDEDEYDEPPRRRRRDEGDATGGLIPYKNGTALAAYYSGVFGLISCFILLGIFGILPIVLGILGLKKARRNPEVGGTAHAIVGMVLGALEVLTFLTQVVVIIVAIISK
jgi:hypothetical protein